MDEVLKVDFEKQTVSARELYSELEIAERFSRWFERMASYGFVENEDFTTVKIGTEVQNNGGVQQRELVDHNLTVDMAKHICMVQRTEKAKFVRQYLIDLEKAWNTPEQVMARALKIADKQIEQLKQNQLLLEQRIEADKPKTIFADAVSASQTSILIGDLAKLLRQNGVEIGQKRLFEWLRNNGYLIKRKGSDWNMPVQRAMEMGLFEIKESTYINGNGCNVTTRTPKVTGKAQVYFINKFLGENKVK